MPISNGLVKNDPVTNAGCSRVIVKNLIKEEQLTGKVEYVMTVACTLLLALLANVEVGMPCFNGTEKCLCLKDPLYELP